MAVKDYYLGRKIHIAFSTIRSSTFSIKDILNFIKFHNHQNIKELVISISKKQ